MLLNQFLSPHFNKRTDKYGGSPENRIRFPKMILQRIREVCAEDFLIETSRISARRLLCEDGRTSKKVFIL
ncbi:MAG: hypothetical protein ACLUD0_02430 [Eubacterium ramulus]